MVGGTDGGKRKSDRRSCPEVGLSVQDGWSPTNCVLVFQAQAPIAGFNNAG